MRNIEKKGKTIKLEFGVNGIPGYHLTADHDIKIKSVLSNDFFKGISVVNLPKKMKGFRSNPDLVNSLKPTKIETEVSFQLNELEYILLKLDEELIVNHHLLLVNEISNGKIINFEVINVGLQDVNIKAGQIIGNALITSGVK